MSDAPDPKAMLDIGTSCPLCHELDFLPLPCATCGVSFCAKHSPSSQHDCSSVSTARITEGKFTEKFSDLLPASREGIIAAERAEVELIKLRRKEAAQALLRKNFGPAASKMAGSSKEGHEEVKKAVVKARSAVVELAILKGKAKQGDPRKGLGEVPVEQRLYFRAYYVEGLDQRGIKELWMPKTTTAGKVLDLLADSFGQTNTNNRNPDPTKLLVLAKPTGESASDFELISSSTSIENAVANGGIVWLMRGPPSPSP